MDIEHGLVVAKGERLGEGMGWEGGIGRCKLLYMEWIAEQQGPTV